MSRRSETKRDPDAWKEGTRMKWMLDNKKTKDEEATTKTFQCPVCSGLFKTKGQLSGHLGWCRGGHKSRRLDLKNAAP